MTEEEQHEEEQTQPEEQPTETQIEEPECMECRMNEMFIALGAAHQSCNSISNDDEKSKCREWAASIDPTNVERAVDIYKKILIQSDGKVDPLVHTAKTYNMSIENAIIEYVNERLEANLEVPEQTMKLFREFTTKRGI